MSNRLLKFRNEKSRKYSNSFYKAILEETGIDIKEKNREDEVVFFRRLYFKFMIEMTRSYGESLSRIAASINQTHATVLYGQRQLENQMAIDPEIHKQYEYYKSISLGNSIVNYTYKSPKSKAIKKEIDVVKTLKTLIKNQRAEIFTLRSMVSEKSSLLNFKTKQFNTKNKEHLDLRSEYNEVYKLYKKSRNISV